VIVEVNISQPEGLEGIHDIFIPEEPPYRKPFRNYSVPLRI
jgi:acyl-CoA hydrolase